MYEVTFSRQLRIRTPVSGILALQSGEEVNAFHVIVTGGGLLFNQAPQALSQGVNDNAAQVVGELLWVLWCLTLSMGALGGTYLGRAAWKMGQGRGPRFPTQSPLLV
jgi:hypothetical protein